MNLQRKYFETFIGGKVRPFKFGTNTTSKYCELRGVHLEDFEKDFDSLAVKTGKTDPSCFRDLLWAALQDGERYAREKRLISYPREVYTPNTVGDWLDDLTVDQKNDLLDNYVKVIGMSIVERINKINEQIEEEKKSLLGNQS